MRTIIIGLTAVSTLIGGAALAQTYEQQQQDYQAKKAQYDAQQAQYQDQKRDYHHAMHEWVRGQVLPHRYFDDHYVVVDWRDRHLSDPGVDYRWVRDEDGNLVRARIGSGVIEEVIVRDPG